MRSGRPSSKEPEETEGSTPPKKEKHARKGPSPSAQGNGTKLRGPTAQPTEAMGIVVAPVRNPEQELEYNLSHTASIVKAMIRMPMEIGLGQVTNQFSDRLRITMVGYEA